MKLVNKTLCLLSLTLLCACAGIFDKDNTPPPSPLVAFTPKVHPQLVWGNKLGISSNHEYLKLGPVVTDAEVVSVDPKGAIIIVDKATGKTKNTLELNMAISSQPAVQNNLIIFGTKNGDAVALDARNSKMLWKSRVQSEILATPAISANIVLIKSIDGKVAALNTHDGHLLWRYFESEPSLILRGASSPQIAQGAAVIGYANGKLVKLVLNSGHELWSQNLTTADGAFPVQRMIDVNADPLISGNQVFAASYGGKIAAFNFTSGRPTWDLNVASYSGIAADSSRIYTTDAKGYIWALDRTNGRVVWKQTQLEARMLTAPAVSGNYLVVGDAQGVLHWLNKNDGSFAGRLEGNGSGFYANPVAQNNIVYTLTKNGYLAAYTLG